MSRLSTHGLLAQIIGLGIAFLAVVPLNASGAILCVVNKSNGQFEPVGRGASAEGACEAPDDAPDLLASFNDVQRSAEQQGTKILGGVIVTNKNDLNRPGLPARGNRNGGGQQVMDWEILESDGTLQQTVARWAESANWRVVWENVPPIQNPKVAGGVKLPGRTFKSAVDYVVEQARVAAVTRGFDLKPTEYPNATIVISKEARK